MYNISSHISANGAMEVNLQADSCIYFTITIQHTLKQDVPFDEKNRLYR